MWDPTLLLERKTKIIRDPLAQASLLMLGVFLCFSKQLPLKSSVLEIFATVQAHFKSEFALRCHFFIDPNIALFPGNIG